jgi:hypothetical protein
VFETAHGAQVHHTNQNQVTCGGACSITTVMIVGMPMNHSLWTVEHESKKPDTRANIRLGTTASAPLSGTCLALGAAGTNQCQPSKRLSRSLTHSEPFSPTPPTPTPVAH